MWDVLKKGFFFIFSSEDYNSGWLAGFTIGFFIGQMLIMGLLSITTSIYHHWPIRALF